MILFIPLFFSLCYSEQKNEILAVNEVIATYTGTRHIPCMFRTALCPDRCDHAHDVAVFNVNKYLKYEKPGEYGDDKVTDFFWNLKPAADTNKLHPEYLNIVKNLKQGQQVKIYWTHFYIHDDNGAYPERCVTHFEIIQNNEFNNL